MHGRMIVAIVAALMSGCSDEPATRPARLILERDARLISIAREAAALEGFSLVDAIYQVRRDGDGWVGYC